MGHVVNQLLRDIPLPRMVKVRQRFDETRLSDPVAQLRARLTSSGAVAAMRPGARVAVCVGSRGIAMLAELTHAVVEELRSAGMEPFIVPAMGSHGGATAIGQTEVLSHLGVEERTVGAVVRSSMDVVEVGRLANGLPVYVDRIAVQEADALVLINRVKPHTAFRGPVESGLLKMLTIGLGNQRGADACHQLGFGLMAEHVVKMARLVLGALPIAFGVAVVENAYDRICRVEVLQPHEMEDMEREMLVLAKARMPRILFDPIDVLVVDYIGKNISGDGLDPNITGRYPTPYADGGPTVTKLAVLDMTPESGGNANGVGTADFTTRRLAQKVDWDMTYANGLTSTVCGPTKLATVLDTDRLALQAAIKTCNILDFTKCRLVRLRDTLHLEEIWISEALLSEAVTNQDVDVLTEPEAFVFDETGYVPK
ncbi:MAG: nickel pincer cofactor-dependent isomerase, group 22 [Bacilli bacterium]